MSNLSEILEGLDMESYLDEFGVEFRLNRGSSGQQLNVKECPVCGGAKWKVYLNADTGLGNCFSGDCESKFNKFTFIKELMKPASSAEVIRHIKSFVSNQGWVQKKRVEFAVDESELILPESVELPFKGKNIKYLTNRGITAEMCRYFHLRYSKCGVFRYKDGENERCQDYSERVIIPIYDIEGGIVSFQGRDITGESDKKYLFPPGYSSTGKYLFNGHNAIGSKRIIICEGVFDTMAVKMAVDTDPTLLDITPVASFGKHLSNGFENDQIEQLIRLKRKGLKEVFIMWDSERLAIIAAIRTAVVISSLGISVRVAILSDGKDPNEVAPEIIRASIKSSEKINRLSAIKLLANYNQK